MTSEAGCHLVGGHSVDDPEPKYGLAVTGVVDPDADAAQRRRPGRPAAVADQEARHRRAQLAPQGHRRGLRPRDRRDDHAEPGRGRRPPSHSGIRCATDVTGFGLLGHCLKLARASGVTAVIDSAAVEYLDGARQAADDGYISGGTRRNLDWVRPHTVARRRRRDSRRCCWPTRRPRAACSSRARSPARRSSASWSRAGEHLSSSCARSRVVSSRRCLSAGAGRGLQSRRTRDERVGGFDSRPPPPTPVDGAVVRMYVIATAGHVDHGKSALLRALTGMEPDRWEEERRRGLTIDLGFVWMDSARGPHRLRRRARPRTLRGQHAGRRRPGARRCCSWWPPTRAGCRSRPSI